MAVNRAAMLGISFSGVKETPAKLQTYEKIAVTEEEKYIKVMKDLQFGKFFLFLINMVPRVWFFFLAFHNAGV